MKKTFLKELLDRRVPQIIGSYFIASITLVGALDWMVARYDLSEAYTTLAIFCLVSIIPSVIVLAYFHGAPGKDDWTKIEKFGIPINILFIGVALFAGYNYNLWQEKPFDHSAIDDTFLIHLSSPKDVATKFQAIDYFVEMEDYADQFGPINMVYLNEIQEYINVNLRKEFMN